MAPRAPCRCSLVAAAQDFRHGPHERREHGVFAFVLALVEPQGSAPLASFDSAHAPTAGVAQVAERRVFVLAPEHDVEGQVDGARIVHSGIFPPPKR